MSEQGGSSPLLLLLKATSKQAIDDFLCACNVERELLKGPGAARIADLVALGTRFTRAADADGPPMIVWVLPEPVAPYLVTISQAAVTTGCGCPGRRAARVWTVASSVGVPPGSWSSVAVGRVLPAVGPLG